MYKYGGGNVVVPPEIFLTGSIHLSSNVCLYLENGVVLKSAAETKDFSPIGFFYNEMGEVTSLIWAMKKVYQFVDME